MRTSRDTELPVPMRASEFAEEFITVTRNSGIGDRIGVSTMQLAPQCDPEESKVMEIVDEMLAANDRGAETQVTVDIAYVKRMTRIGNRDFPDFLPVVSAKNRAERAQNRETAGHVLAKLAARGVLVESATRPMDRGYTPRLRQVGSFHPLQLFSARHAKEAHVVRHNGDTMAWVTSANFTDSDLTDPNLETGTGMNNLAFRISDNLARFVIRSLENGFGHTGGAHRYSSDGITVIHDVNNSGEPARLPSILQEALLTIDPKRAEMIADPTIIGPKSPTHVVVMSQYLPDGLLRSALEQTSRHADVHVPTQPRTDHRVKSFPYNLHTLVQARGLDNSRVECFRRAVPSHVKALIAKYDDGTARIIGGTDNFTTHLQKFVRNEELAIIVDLNLKDEGDFEYFERFVSLVCAMGEISCNVKDDLL